jgi:hypothetical protein
MIKRITLTDEHIRLISFLHFEKDKKRKELFIDLEDPYELSGRLQDIALVLGYRDKAIPGTESDPEGAAFPDEIEQHLLEVHHYVVDNLYYIESLIHQMFFKEPITPGTYKCIDTETVWEKES